MKSTGRAGDWSSPESSESLLKSFKYKGYMIVLVAGALTTLVSWVIELSAGNSSGFNRVADPSLALFCGFLAGTLLFGRERVLRFVEWAGYVVLVAYFLFNVYYVIYISYEETNTLEDLSTLSPWVPMVYILGYLIFGFRKGLLASSLFYAALLGISLPYVLSRVSDIGVLREVHVFLHVYLSGLVSIALLFILAYFTGGVLQSAGTQRGYPAHRQYGFPDRYIQPASPLRSPRRRSRESFAKREATVHGHVRPRPLQADKRHPRSRRRRQITEERR